MTRAATGATGRSGAVGSQDEWNGAAAASAAADGAVAVERVVSGEEWENGASTVGAADGQRDAPARRAAPGERTRLGLDRSEVVRLVLQQLEDLGYVQAVRALERESRCHAQSGWIRQLRERVRQGEWEAAVEVLQAVDATASSSEPVTWERAAATRLEEARFLLMEEKFLELLRGVSATSSSLSTSAAVNGAAAAAADLDADATPVAVSTTALWAALQCLREELAPLEVAMREPLRMHRLVLALLEAGAPADGADPVNGSAAVAERARQARELVFQRLQRLFPKECTVESGRLELLLYRALRQNLAASLYPYTRQRQVSLLEDMVFDPSRVPTHDSHTLRRHTNEVWHVQFSHDGRWLASGGKDAKIVLWDMSRLDLTAGDASTRSRLVTAAATATPTGTRDGLRSPSDASSDGDGEHDSSDHARDDDEVEERGDSAAEAIADSDRRLVHSGTGRGSVVATATDDARLALELHGHRGAVNFLAWSPNDRLLLSAANDMEVRVWHVHTGKCIWVCQSRHQPVTACAWLPDGERLLVCYADRQAFIWRLTPAVATTTAATDASPQISPAACTAQLLLTMRGRLFHDVAFVPGSHVLVGVSDERQIHRYVLGSSLRELEPWLAEDDLLTSLSLSRTDRGRYALVNVSSESQTHPEIHEWDLQAGVLVRRYVGLKQGRFVIRSCFGGVNDCFVVSGSEDMHVYLWQRNDGRLLAKLPGHSGTVNAVCWNPRHDSMFASASDDGMVRLWQAPGAARVYPR